MEALSRVDRQKRRVIFLNRYFDPDQSATSQMLTDLARSVAARGYEVHVVCSRQLYDDASRRLPLSDTLSGVRVHRVATTYFGRSALAGRAMDYASFYFSCAVMTLTLLRRGDLLVAKTDPPLLSILAAPIAKLKGAALINWQQDMFPEVATHLGANPLPRWLDRGLKWLRDASLRAANMNVLIGNCMREYLANRGIPNEKLCVIENWADGATIKPKPATMSALRAQLNLAGRFVVCYSGNLGRAHEVETLLDAAQMLDDSGQFGFLFIGGGAKVDALKRAVTDRRLESFRFLPYQTRESLGDSLAAADVHLVSLLPALEGLIVPSKLYGILAAGRPLIFVGAPAGEVARIIDRAQCGRTVPIGDAIGLRDMLRSLQTDLKGLNEMGARAARLFDEEYALHRAIDRWMTLIDAT
jgi:colanic acid biosynthesis glycosyl transferase WcaI